MGLLRVLAGLIVAGLGLLVGLFGLLATLIGILSEHRPVPEKLGIGINGPFGLALAPFLVAAGIRLIRRQGRSQGTSASTGGR